MYGYQGNNSQSYNYQNPNGSSYGNISQYTGPYHPYYSSASTTYNAFPSNDQPCSSLGMLPQEYSQVGNGIPRPYFFDSNSSYPRSYQGLQYNQSVEIPIANSYSGCPRNCHCCESMKPKYFTAGSAIQQQANTQSICDPSVNAAYNGLRKGINSGRWRESSSQLSNFHESNDSSSSWIMPKYGTSLKSEPCMWSLTQKQPGKLESVEHLAPSNTYMLPQQHQRKPVQSSHTYSVLHSNPLMPVQTSRAPQGRNDGLMGNCFSGYQYNSDYQKSIADLQSYSKPHMNKIASSNPPRPAFNLNSNCEGGFPYKFSSPNANTYHENQKCSVDSPKLVAQLPGAFVESLQRRLSGNNLVDATSEISYCQPSMISSIHSIDASSRQAYSIPTESDSRFVINCGSSASNNALPANKLQLPSIHSIRPPGKAPSKSFGDDFSYISPRNPIKNNNDSNYSVSSTKNIKTPNVSVRNVNVMTSERIPTVPSENTCRIQSPIESGCTLTNYLQGNRQVSKHFNAEPSSDLLGADKMKICKDVPVKSLSSANGNPVVGDLRHFLTTWDDGDDEESNSVAPCVLPLSNDCAQEHYARDGGSPDECSSINHPQEKTDDDWMVVCRNSSGYGAEPKEIPGGTASYASVDSFRVFDNSSENNTLTGLSNENTDISQSALDGVATVLKSTCNLERHARAIIVKTGINNLHSDVEQRSQDIYDQMILSSHSGSNPITMNGMITDASKNGGSRSSSHTESVNSSGKSAATEGPSERTLSGKEVAVTNPTSQVIFSGVTNGSSYKENQAELHDPVDAILGSMEGPSCIRSVERQNPDLGNLESQNSLSEESGKDNSAPDITESTITCSPSSRSTQVSNEISDKFSSNQSSGSDFFLNKLKDDSDTLNWNISESAKGILDKKDLDGNQTKPAEDKPSETEVKCMLKDQNASNEVVAVDEYYDDTSHGNGQDLGIKDFHHQNIFNSSTGEYSSTEENIVVFGKDRPRKYPKDVVTSFRVCNKISCSEKLLPVNCTPLEEAEETEPLNVEMHNALEKDALHTRINCDENNQEKSCLEVSHCLPLTESQVISVRSINGGEIKMSSLNKCEESTSKLSRVRKEEGKRSLLDVVRKAVKKSSYKAARLIKRKYHVLGLCNKGKIRLTEVVGTVNAQKLAKKGMLGVASGHKYLPVKKDVESCTEKKCFQESSIIETNNEKHEIGQCVHIKLVEGDHQNVNDEFDKDQVNLKNGENCVMVESDTFAICQANFPGQFKSLEENSLDVDCIPAEEVPSEENDTMPIFAAGEGELGSFDGNCVIGNVEVFMGTVGDANSFEEVVEGSNTENEFHDETCMHEETANVQYWCNYELGNDLGVAMEIEVGSEIDCNDNVVLKHQDEQGLLCYDECHGNLERCSVRESAGQQVTPVEQTNVLLVQKFGDSIDKDSKDSGDMISRVNGKEDTFHPTEENNEKCDVNSNNSVTCCLNIGHSENHPDADRSSIEEIESQQMVIGLTIEGPHQESHLQGDIAEVLASEIKSTFENSEVMEVTGQEIQKLCKSEKLKVNSDSIKTKDRFSKRCKKCMRSLSNSACTACCESHQESMNRSEPGNRSELSNHTLNSSKNTPNTKNLIQSHSVSDFNIIHQPVESDKVNFTSLVSSENEVKLTCKSPSITTDNIKECKRTVSKVCSFGVNDKGRNSAHKIKKSKVEVIINNENSPKEKLSVADKTSHMTMKFKKKKNSSPFFSYEGDNNQCQGDSVEMHQMPTSLALCQQEQSLKALPLKTKGSLKSLGRMKLKGVKCSRFGFWKNRSWPYKSIYGKIFRNATLKKKTIGVLHKIPQPSTHSFPQILHTCPTPPPNPLSPLPTLEADLSIPHYICDGTSCDPSQVELKPYPTEENSDDVKSSCLAHSPSSVENQYSDDFSDLHPHRGESNFPSENTNGNLCQTPHEMGIMLDETVHLTHMPSIPSDACEEKQLTSKMSESAKVSENLDLDVTSTDFCNDDIHPWPTIPEERNSYQSHPVTNLSSDAVTSNLESPPPVRISFKKVINGSNKNVWMKRPVSDYSVKNQESLTPGEAKIARQKMSLEFESPVPKVTIKKKSGENGYQSFLSGFSPASSSPSASPKLNSKSDSPVHYSAKNDKVSVSKCNGEESMNDATSVNLFHSVPAVNCENKSHDIQENETSMKNANTKCAFIKNVVEKKEGSGLVFVIRGLGHKVMGYSAKDQVMEKKSSLPARDVNLANGTMSEASECLVSCDDWESGPWCTWQPVVRLSRSDKLDALARGFNRNIPEGTINRDIFESSQANQDGFRKDEHQKITCNKVHSISAHDDQSNRKEFEQKSKKMGDKFASKNHDGEIIFNRGVPYVGFGTDKVKFDMIMRECDQLSLPRKKAKSEKKLQLAQKTMMPTNTHDLGPVDVNWKGSVHSSVKEGVEVGLRSNNDVNEEISLSQGCMKQTEKNECGSDDAVVSTISSKETPINGEVKEVKKQTWRNRMLERHQGRDKQDMVNKKRIEEENGAVVQKDTTKLENSKLLCSAGIKVKNVPLKTVPNQSFGGEVNYMDGGCGTGMETAPDTIQEPQKDYVQSTAQECEKKSISQPNDQGSFRCEACCRKFPSQKWLMRHCEGLSHSRVENAQRQAVQALLLLLTGSESHLLQPLTERELDHLKSWSSRAMPSPLQLALKEFLDKT